MGSHPQTRELVTALILCVRSAIKARTNRHAGGIRREDLCNTAKNCCWPSAPTTSTVVRFELTGRRY